MFFKLRQWYLSKIQPFFVSTQCNILLIAIGAGLRLNHYLTNRSFWLDETCLSVSLISRSLKEILLHKYIFEGFARPPLIFLFIEKFAVNIFGNNEYAFRLFPLISSILSVVLFYFILKKVVNKKAIPIALGLFVFSDPLIYYAAELKQYSTDVLMALVLYWVVGRMGNKKYDIKNILFLGIGGACLLWISNTGLFILAGIGTTTAGFCIVRKQWRELGKFCFACLLWALSFFVLYKISLSQMVNDKSIWDTWSGAYPPCHFTIAGYVKWIKLAFLSVFEHPLGLFFQPLAAVLFFIGGYVMLKRDNERFFLILSPLFFTILAASLHKYPFRGRLLLFLAPSIIIFLAEGIRFVINKSGRASFLIGVALIAVLFYHPCKTAAHYVITKRCIVENREVIHFFKERFQPGDNIFVNNHGHIPLIYYAGGIGLAVIPDEKKSLFNEDAYSGVIIKNIFDTVVDDGQGTPAYARYKFDAYNKAGLFRRSYLINNIDEKHGYPVNKEFMKLFERQRAWLIFSMVDPVVESNLLKLFMPLGIKLEEIHRKKAAAYLFYIYPNATDLRF